MKLIQSLAMGLPAIVTPRVARLGGVSDGREVLVAEAPTQWTDAICRLLQDSDLAENLSASGRSWFETHHAPLAVNRQLHDAYAATLGAVRESRRGRTA